MLSMQTVMLKCKVLKPRDVQSVLEMIALITFSYFWNTEWNVCRSSFCSALHDVRWLRSHVKRLAQLLEVGFLHFLLEVRPRRLCRRTVLQSWTAWLRCLLLPLQVSFIWTLSQTVKCNQLFTGTQTSSWRRLPWMQASSPTTYLHCAWPLCCFELFVTSYWNGELCSIDKRLECSC